LSGYQVDYIPGWDCHGLPIELNALKSLKKSKTSIQNIPNEIRKNANDYAQQCIKTQMESFKQMNLLADWKQIYRTIDTDFMCSEIDLFYDLFKKKLIYRDYMPVYWSVSSQTALAEFELEYNAEHKSNALYVSFELKQYSNELKNLLSK
jgi:isoleucyl-tRNA synthetase